MKITNDDVGYDTNQDHGVSFHSVGKESFQLLDHLLYFHLDPNTPWDYPSPHISVEIHLFVPYGFNRIPIPTSPLHPILVSCEIPPSLQSRMKITFFSVTLRTIFFFFWRNRYPLKSVKTNLPLFLLITLVTLTSHITFHPSFIILP